MSLSVSGQESFFTARGSEARGHSSLRGACALEASEVCELPRMARLSSCWRLACASLRSLVEANFGCCFSLEGLGGGGGLGSPDWLIFGTLTSDWLIFGC